MIAIGVSPTPIFVRLTRGAGAGRQHEEYVEAARALGNPHCRIALRHVLPNIVPPLLVQATLATAAAIIAEAALVVPGSWRAAARAVVGQHAEHRRRISSRRRRGWRFGRALAIFLVVLSLNLFGDGLRDALDPRAK